MYCAECRAFLSNYHLATLSYGQSTEKLSTLAVGKNFNSPDFQRLKKEVQEARDECLRAKEALRVHKESHAAGSRRSALYSFGYPSMRPGDQYKMKTPTLGILSTPGIYLTPDRRPVVITAGSVITVVKPDGMLVDVGWDGKSVSMFSIDVTQCGELLSRAAVTEGET